MDALFAGVGLLATIGAALIAVKLARARLRAAAIRREGQWMF